MAGLGPLAKIKDLVPLPLLETCGGCNLNKTKPPQPMPIIAGLVDFLEVMSGRQALGLTTATDSLSWQELAAVDGKARALSMAKRKDDAKRRKRDMLERMRNAANNLSR